jgi:hypothetical protein
MRWSSNILNCSPCTIQHGYQLRYILPPSKKMPESQLRRIKVKTVDNNEVVFSIAPSFVMPYMTGYTEEIKKALSLRRFGVPFWGLTYVFGHDDPYGERLELHRGHSSLVGTTVKHAEHLPQEILADEKHTWLSGEKVYVATTVGRDCVWGASVAVQGDATSLQEAYGQSQAEAHNLSADYQPQTVNTDGWKATQTAGQSLFPSITVILCFLQAFLKIRERCPQMTEHLAEIRPRVWGLSCNRPTRLSR